MRKIKLAFTIICISTITYGQYTTPGTAVNWNMDDLVANSSGTVTNDTTVYFINGDLTIALTDTLKIEEDITLKFASEVLLDVEGVLKVLPPRSTKLTAIDTLSNWLGLRFYETNESVVKDAIIEFGGGIKVLYSNMMFENCRIQKNNNEQASGAIDVFHSDAIIKDCEFYYNMNAAISSSANAGSSPQILNNRILYNTTDNSNRPQINLGSANTDSIRIIGNYILGNQNNVGGISVATLAGGEILCVIENNIIQNNRYGINVQGNNISTRITNNIIKDNNLETNPFNGGSGISFYGGTSNISSVSKNEISGNLWGITIIQEAMPNLGEIDGGTVNIGLNKIFNNGNSGVVYDLYNNTPNEIMAENNFWGTFNLDTIEINIFHEPDDGSLGLVDYLPIAEEIVIINEKEITYFAFEELNPIVVGVIDTVEKTINLQVPYETDVTNLVATFENTPMSAVYVGNIEQTSGTTANDFSEPITYHVVAYEDASNDYLVTVDVAVNSTEKHNENAIKIYPNPAFDKIYIQTKEDYNVLKIYDITSNRINSQELLGKENVIDVSGLKAGLYFVKITGKKSVYTRRLIVD